MHAKKILQKLACITTALCRHNPGIKAGDVFALSGKKMQRPLHFRLMVQAVSSQSVLLAPVVSGAGHIGWHPQDNWQEPCLTRPGSSGDTLTVLTSIAAWVPIGLIENLRQEGVLNSACVTYICNCSVARPVDEDGQPVSCLEKSSEFRKIESEYAGFINSILHRR